MDRLACELGVAEGALWVKRDDCTGLAGGGNKVRKLDYLCADAIEQRCDVLLAGGGRQSNHTRLTAAAANRLGLDCTIVVSSDRTDEPTGNLLLDMLMGADLVWAGPLQYYALEDAISETAERLRAAGRRPYAMPIGGASAVGALGYVDAAGELLAVLPDVDLVVVADGSGGTHAGLAAGLGDFDRVLGVDVGTRPDLDDVVPAKAAEVAALAGFAAPRGSCAIDHDRFGAGYGEVTSDVRVALDLAARTEGLVLDPVYTGKAMAGLIAGVRAGRISRGDQVVFVHTGGTPALFARRYAGWIAAGPVSPPA